MKILAIIHRFLFSRWVVVLQNGHKTERMGRPEADRAAGVHAAYTGARIVVDDKAKEIRLR